MRKSPPSTISRPFDGPPVFKLTLHLEITDRIWLAKNQEFTLKAPVKAGMDREVKVLHMVKASDQP